MMKKILTICLLLVSVISFAQVSKTNSTPLTLSSGPTSGSRTFVYTSGDFGGCTSLTEVEISITLDMGNGALDCNAAGDPYSVQEDLALRLTSPTGTSVDLVFDKWDFFEPNLGNTLSSFVTVPTHAVLFDDDAASIISGDWSSWTTARPVEPLSAFDGEDATGTWTLSMADGHSQFSASDFFCLSTATLTVTCGVACSDPDVPTLSATPATICPGASSTLSITGNLNDATNWHIYTGSCGGTQIGTTSTSSFVVSPATTTTYYIRGEGGCVTPGTCGQVTVTAQDVTNPTITCPGNQVGNVDGSCVYTLPDYTSLATAADNCTASPTVTQSPAPGTNVGVGTTVITLTATDGSSNTANCNFNVVVSDVTNPTITCPGNQVGNVNASCVFSLPDYTSLATAADNCPGVVVLQVPAPGTNVGVGTTNIVLTAMDASTNTANCNFDVVVSDATNPTITCPGNQVGNVNASCVFSLPDYTSLATAADNCPGVVVTQVPAPGTNVGVGTTNIVLTATDASSNTANCNFNVVVSDATNPTITCPGNQIGNVNASCVFSLPDYTSLATAADNCPGVVVTQVPAPGTNVGVGTTNIVLTATDASSNTANCNFDVVVSDATNPTITCPGNQVGNVNASCVFSLPDYTSLATAADNCPGVVVTQVPAPGTNVGVGTTNIVLTATDASSNTANCNFNVVVSDATNPTITCPGNQVGNVNASCVFSLPDYTSLATAADNCPGVVVTQVPAPGTNVGVGTTNIVLTATDASSNTANCNFDVVVSDNTAPTVTCPGNQTETPNASCQFTLPDYTGLASAIDNCTASLTVTQSPAPGTVISGTTTITLSATDGASNTGQCTFDVILNDATAPTAVCQNINVYLDGAGNATIVAADLDGGSTDNCAGLTFSASQTAFTCADLGANNVTLAVTDGNSNTDNCVAIVTVLDTVSPVATCPGNQTENPNASCQFTLPDYTSLVAATDNCGSPTVTQSPASGTVITGTTTITMTADDGNGNTSTCTFDVILNDATAPTAVCQNINVYLDGTGNATIVAADLDGGSTDNCTGLTFGASQTAFTCADLGANNVTLTVTDGNSNTDNCVAVVTVMDTIVPTITCPGTQVGSPIVACQFTLPDYTGLVTGADNCGSPTITQSPAPGTMISATSTITMTADDGNGNTAMCTFDVTVNATISVNDSTSICQGDSILLGGSYQTTAGTYVDSLTTMSGCDSVVTTILTIGSNYSDTVSTFICDGDSILLGGAYQMTAGTYVDSLATTGGCDSLVTTNLSVYSDSTVTADFFGSTQSGGSTIQFFNQSTGAASYMWYFGDGDTSSVVNPLHVYPNDTSYLVCLVATSPGGCGTDSLCKTVITVIGIDELMNDESVVIYPNPTAGTFTVSLSELEQNSFVAVYDVLGKQMMREPLKTLVTTIDLTGREKGVYFVHIQTDQGNRIYKVVKK